MTQREPDEALSAIRRRISEVRGRGFSFLETCEVLDRENCPIPLHVKWHRAGSWTQAYKSDCQRLVREALSRWAQP